MEELISIIVPVYNLEGYIGRTLDSILGQSYKNIEIITVDDGSKDGSWAVLQEYAARDPRIRPLHQENGGVTAARLRGVQEARGQWIGFVDGDDTVEPQMYQLLLKNALAHEADISHCGYVLELPQGKSNFFYGTGKRLIQDNRQGLCDLLEGSLVEPGLWNKLYRRELFSGLDAWMPRDIRINEDVLMNFYLFSGSGKSVFEDVCLYHYIVRQGSATQKKTDMHKIYDPIRVRERMLQEAGEEILPVVRKAFLSICIIVYNSMITARDRSYKNDLQAVRQKLLAHKEWRGLLGKKQRLLYGLIVAVPRLYPGIYGVYAKLLLKDRYG